MAAYRRNRGIGTTEAEYQRREARSAALRLDLSDVIPLVEKKLRKEGLGKLSDLEIALALSTMATQRLRYMGGLPPTYA